MRLLEPFRIGPTTLRNRIVMSAMGTALATEDGRMNERAIAWYSRRAAGGAAMVTLEAAAVDRRAVALPNNVLVDADECIEGLSRLARSLHSHGARLSVQIWHPGHAAGPSPTGDRPVAPSPIPPPGGSDPPRELAIPEIEELVERFAAAAWRAREAGADAVEIHCGHGYLIAQFLSPLLNQRTDEYGGDPRRRARFAVEVVSRVKERVGRDLAVLCKLSAQEHVEGGLTVDDTGTIARWLQEAGADAFVISSGSRFAGYWTIQPMMFPRGCLVPFAAAIKSAVEVPVGALGRINEPALAEKVLQEGQADFVNLGRALIADPDFPLKVAEGRVDEIRTCIACGHCSHTLNAERKPLKCTVNPEAGRELEWKKPEAAPRRKKVLVIGAGPGGLEAACVAGQRGHDVTLCDRSDAMGGMVALGCKPPSKAELRTILDYYSGELVRRGVAVQLNKEVTPETVEAMGPEVVVAATGSVPLVPPIPGVDQPHVVQVRDLLAGRVEPSGSAVVIGGGSVGCEAAELLRARGLEVAVIEMLGDFALDLEGRTRAVFLPHLRSMGIKMVSDARVVRIEGRKVVYRGADGQEAAEEGDTIVLAVGARPNTELIDALKSRGVSVLPLGDCVEVRKIHNAIYEGAMAGREV